MFLSLGYAQVIAVNQRQEQPSGAQKPATWSHLFLRMLLFCLLDFNSNVAAFSSHFI